MNSMSYWMIAQIFLRNETLTGTLYQNKLLQPGVQIAVNSNEIKFEPHGDLVDITYSCYNVTKLTIKIILLKLKIMKQAR